MTLRLCLAALSIACGFARVATTLAAELSTPPSTYYGIHVVDDATGRGVPLVELRTVSNLRYVTDSAGWVAFDEPGLMNEPTYFHLFSHGYSYKKDGFGNTGVMLTPKSGERAEIKLHRENIAERLYRVTGQGLYRDSTLLDLPTPLKHPNLNAQVVGQDSVMAVVYRGKLHWFWGDTERAKYALGHFRTAAATSELPTSTGGLAPEVGVNLNYITGEDGFSRGVCQIDGPGPVWIDGLAVVPDDEGRERLVAHYSRMERLDKRVEHGIVVWNDEAEKFEKHAEFDLERKWQVPAGHALRQPTDDTEYLLFANPCANVRVPADLKSIGDQDAYETFTCLQPSGEKVDREESGVVRWSWRRDSKPVGPVEERRLVKAGALKQEECRCSPIDVETGKPVALHGGAVRWSKFRKEWILIAVAEYGKSSYLGEVYFAGAPDPTGPWTRARKIATHEKYSFYNPALHEFFFDDEARYAYFEGTYTHTFSGNPDRTPRYDYNQIMYRLDLADERLRLQPRDD